MSVNESTITFDYVHSSLSEAGFATLRASGLSLEAGVWYHLAVTVFEQDVAFYVNGGVLQVATLEGSLVDSSRSISLGRLIQSEPPFPFGHFYLFLF